MFKLIANISISLVPLKSVEAYHVFSDLEAL